MRYFLVIVFPWKTEVREFQHPLGNVHKTKTVDGDVYHYSIKAANSLHPDDKHWMQRAEIQIDYHALMGCVEIDKIVVSDTKRLGQLITQEQKELF